MERRGNSEDLPGRRVSGSDIHPGKMKQGRRERKLIRPPRAFAGNFFPYLLIVLQEWRLYDMERLPHLDILLDINDIIGRELDEMQKMIESVRETELQIGAAKEESSEMLECTAAPA